MTLERIGELKSGRTATSDVSEAVTRTEFAELLDLAEWALKQKAAAADRLAKHRSKLKGGKGK
jgi:hypothetical protein